jgi:hypothetical protein
MPLEKNPDLCLSTRPLSACFQQAAVPWSLKAGLYFRDSGVVLLAFTIPKSEPDFGFGVDPGRLRGYPLAHLAGTWW